MFCICESLEWFHCILHAIFVNWEKTDNPLRSKYMREINHENIRRPINASALTMHIHTLNLYPKNPLETNNVLLYNIDVRVCAKKQFISKELYVCFQVWIL